MLSGAGAVRTAVAQAGKTAVKAADDVAGAAGAASKVGNVAEIKSVPNLGNVDDFMTSQFQRLNTKLGDKIRKGELPVEMSKTGFEQAKLAVKETLSNATSVTEVIPSSAVRGNYDLIHVYSAKTNSTVSLRVLPEGKYEFDTLIPGKSSKF
jgi:filamentous hemagglutinin